VISDVSRYCRLSGARASSDSDDEGFQHAYAKVRIECVECIMPFQPVTETLSIAGSTMKITTLAISLSLFSVIACNGMAPGSPTPDPSAQTSLRVDNQSFSDVTVYAARSAQRVRLGLAPGHTNTVFTVPAALMSGLTPLRFIADPIGGVRPSVSEEITVSPGDSVVLQIPPL
jgi:hypothetical protein